MFKQNDPRRNRTLRGSILQLIYLAGNGETLNPRDPFAMSRGILDSALEQLRQLPSDIDLNNALRYLEEKNYVHVVWAAGQCESIRLLSTGIDLVEQSTTDPGVYLPPNR